MIRRACSWNHATVAAPALVSGWCLGWLKRVDASENETMVMVFESGADGSVQEVPDIMITFTDGQPAVVPTF
jgi:hypothetical protein